MKLLHIDSSALGTHSVSRELTARVVARLQQDQPDLQVTYRDLAAAPLDHWSPTAASGTDILDEFLAADVIVLGAPMYNFAIPTQLKAWIDRILVAGTTFRYTADGPQGLVRGKRVIVASVRGGAYSEGQAAVMDFQEPYLRAALGFIGIDQVEFVRAEGVAAGPQQKERALAEAGQAIGALARAA